MDSPTSTGIDLDRLEIPNFSDFESEQFKKEIVVPYFKDIYKDLASRSDKKSSGINKVTIIDYCQLPGILAERFFSLLDDNGDEYIDLKEFVYVMFKIYYSKFEDQVKLVFDIYDFDKDGYITKEDVRIILSYIPALRDEQSDDREKEGTFSQGGGGYEEFSTRVKIQEEISELIDLVFKEKENLDLAQFQEINETISSDMLVTVLTLLRDKLPCSENFYHHQEEFEKQLSQSSEGLRKKKKDLTIDTKSIPSPTVLKSLSPLARNSTLKEGGGNSSAISQLQKLIKQESMKEDSKGINEEDIDLDKFKHNKKRLDSQATLESVDNIESPEMKGEMVRLANKNPEPKSLLSKGSVKNIFASPTAFLGGSGAIKVDAESPDNTKEPIQFQGEMMRKARENKLKKYWYALQEKELYVFKNKGDEKHKTMINLIGVFLRIDPEEPLDKKNVIYPFTLLFPNKERTFYMLSEKGRDEWVSHIKKAIGYAHLYDYYDIKESVGKGKFGTIKVGIHKKTGKKVAVKIMKKKQMTLQDIVLQKREIEILKICQHPSIIRLLDVFENHEYIYIVMEYCKGGDLFTFLEKRDFTVPEAKSKELAHSIATGIFYLHSFGIAHRDLKPENILMTDSTDEAQPKLVDFGLSKIVGPSETCNDPFGTLSYVAPEVLLQKPYDKSVDLWSLGVIIYLLISGTLPFDDDDDREIARQTIHDDPDFTYKVWKKIDPSTIDMIK